MECDQLQQVMQALEEQHLNEQRRLDIFVKLLSCVRDNSNADSLIRRNFQTAW